MALELNRFTSELFAENPITGDGGVARGSHFEVRFNFPNALGNEPRRTESLALRCDSISFPSRAPLTSNIKYFGPERRKVYGYDSAPVTATVILSQNMIERELFLRWQDLAVGTARNPNQQGSGTANSFLVGYYKNYTADVEIIKYNDAGFKTQTTTLIEAFPGFVGEVGTAWDSEDILKINVTLNYRYFTDEPRGGNLGLDPRLIGIFQSVVNGRFEQEAREIASEEINTRVRNFF